LTNYFDHLLLLSLLRIMHFINGNGAPIAADFRPTVSFEVRIGHRLWRMAASVTGKENMLRERVDAFNYIVYAAIVCVWTSCCVAGDVGRSRERRMTLRGHLYMCVVVHPAGIREHSGTARRSCCRRATSDDGRDRPGTSTCLPAP